MKGLDSTEKRTAPRVTIGAISTCLNKGNFHLSGSRLSRHGARGRSAESSKVSLTQCPQWQVTMGPLLPPGTSQGNRAFASLVTHRVAIPSRVRSYNLRALTAGLHSPAWPTLPKASPGISTETSEACGKNKTWRHDNLGPGKQQDFASFARPLPRLNQG